MRPAGSTGIDEAVDGGLVDGRRAFALAVALPLLSLALAWFSSVLIDGWKPVGPVDRAVLGWAITVPLAVASPGFAAMLIPLVRPASLGRVALAIAAIVVCAAVTVMLATSLDSIGFCERITDRGAIFVASLQNGIVAAAIFIAAALFAPLVIGPPFGQPAPRRASVARFVAGTLTGFGGFWLAILFFSATVWHATACAPGS